MRLPEHVRALTDLDYHELDPRHLGEGESRDITQLVALSVMSDYPATSVGAATRVAEGWLVRASRLQKGYQPSPVEDVVQRYSQQRLYVACETTGRPVALVTAANNASGPDTRMGHLEIGAKLHMPTPRFIRSRYHWLGMRAIQPQVAEAIQKSPEDINVTDVLIALSLRRKSSHQTVSSYPWSGEEWWKTTLCRAGLVHDTAADEPIIEPPISPQPVRQERWSAPLETVRMALHLRNYGREVISAARKSLSRG